jgi:hypothetical protein
MTTLARTHIFPLPTYSKVVGRDTVRRVQLAGGHSARLWVEACKMT